MKDVLLKITGSIKRYEKGREVDEDVMEFITEGQFSARGRTAIVIYPEMEGTGLEDYNTHITITPNKVKMKRQHKEEKDDIQSEMEFEKGKRCDALYMGPQGPMGLELLTNNISVNEDEKKKYSLDYTMCLKGLAETRNILNIEILRDL